MDLNLTEEQTMLKDAAKEFLAIECPRSLVRKMEDHITGHDHELWSKMAELGWLGLVFPEEYSGVGMSFQDMTVVLEEMGASLMPGPYFSTVVLCGQAIRDFGTENQMEKYLNGIANGEMIVALANTESNGKYDASGIELVATPENDGYILTGTKMFVQDGQVADHFLVSARSGYYDNPEEGVSFFLVDAESSGVEVVPLDVVGIDKQAKVVFDQVKIASDRLVGPIDHGWIIAERLLAWGSVGKCIEAIGGGEVAMGMAVDYVNRRPAFGRRVGNFQAIQHHCANMLKDLETSRTLAYQAAWLVSEGRFDSQEIYVAKAWINGAYRRITTLAHQCHGGISFIKEMDLHFFYKKAMINESLFGDTNFHWEKIATFLDI
jgi:alkylation response protein AidB-like acyl-CoA dehydrogenase